ncbi:hypothetical protein ABZ621_23790 [Streptomyces sp. NPDC007863]|uniref:hypothetical protein n=1 Tax=Streptomyces sp. NPDC007863 TaxID=3154894 RepID=UPI0033C2CAEB
MILHEKADEILRDVGVSGSADLYTALSLGRLFWPELTVVDGAVFLALRPGDEQEIERRVAGRREAPEGADSYVRGWTEFVESLNTVEVRYLFDLWPQDASRLEEAEDTLAGLLAEVWSARLRAAFPEREFRVVVDDSPESDGPCVVVRQTLR